MKLVKDMTHEEHREFVSNWIKEWEERKEFADDGLLNAAKEHFKKDELKKAKDRLTQLLEKYERYLVERYETFVNNLSMQDKELEQQIKISLQMKNTHETNILLHRAIEEGKLRVTEEEMKLINDFANEDT